MRKNKRKNYFIKRSFQYNFFIKFALLLFVEAVLIAALFLFISRGTLTTAYSSGGLVIQKTGAYFLYDFILITFAAGLSIGIAGIFVFMYLTHRIGGALYKIEKTLELVANGDFSQRVHLRDTDQLQDLKDILNQLLENTDKQVSRIRSDVEELELFIGTIPTTSDTEDLKTLISRVKMSLKDITTAD